MKIRFTSYVKAVLFATLLAAQVTCSGSSGGSDQPATHAGAHWSYSGETGPEHWGDLDPAWETCKTGANQSPIDITDPLYSEAANTSFFYTASKGTVVNNGHTIMFTPDSGGYMTIGGERYDLLQIHFHSPSEHLLYSSQFDMEGHLVHKSASGRYAVVATFFANGAANDAVNAIWGLASDAENKETAMTEPLDPSALLFYQKSYFRYEGSLTTPPCSEGLVWIVLQGVMTASPDQFNKLTGLFGPNARPTQPLNGRTPSFSR